MCLLRHCAICRAGGGRGRKRGSVRNLGVAGGALFNGEDARQPYAKGHPIWGAN